MRMTLKEERRVNRIVDIRICESLRASASARWAIIGIDGYIEVFSDRGKDDL